MSTRRPGPGQAELPRAHDLPPRWDGCLVRWTWRELPGWSQVFICPPPKPEPCRVCTSTGPLRHASGFLANSPDVTLEQINAADSAGRLGSVGVFVLALFRCTGCGHDMVFDMVQNEMWDLDPTDYTDDGSTWNEAPRRGPYAES